MAAIYSDFSPWAITTTTENYLDLLTIRPVPAASDDILYTIAAQYNMRPDLLAFDLYGNAQLWWVFIQRNMDVLQDPIFDFVPGTKIYIPKGSNLSNTLGI
jgi:Base plate wedge protein 53